MVYIPDYNSKCNQLTVAVTLIQLTNVIHITCLLNMLHYDVRAVLLNFVGPPHIWTYKTSFRWKVVRKLACRIFLCTVFHCVSMSLVFFSILLECYSPIQTICSSFTHNQTHVNHNYTAQTQICDCIFDFCSKYSYLVHNTIMQKYISEIKIPIT